MIADDRPTRSPENEAGEAQEGMNRDAEDPVRVLTEQFAAFRAFFERFAQAKVDLARARVRRLLTRALAMLLVVLVVVTTAVTGAVYVVHGTALATTEAFGGQAGPGYILGGLACVLLAVGGSALGIWLVSLRRRHEIIDKYEQSGSVERTERAPETEEAAQEAA